LNNVRKHSIKGNLLLLALVIEILLLSTAAKPTLPHWTDGLLKKLKENKKCVERLQLEEKILLRNSC